MTYWPTSRRRPKPHDFGKGRVRRDGRYIVRHRKQVRRKISAHVVQFDHAVVHHGHDAMNWTAVAFMGEADEIKLT